MVFTYRWSLLWKCFGTFLSIMIVAGMVNSLSAQKVWGGKRAPRVEVAEVKTRILANFADVQGRVIAGPRDAVIATTDAITQLAGVRLGDLVKSGDVIAIQESATLELQLKKVRAKLREAELKLADSWAELQAEAGLLAVNQAQAALLSGKAKRAKGLVAKNALAADAAEMAFNASMAANLSLLARQSSIDRKKAQQKIYKIMIDQKKAEVAQLLTDIEATKLRAKIGGQVTFISDYRRGFARKGEIVAKITDMSSFEIEAEIPVRYVSFLENLRAVSGRSLGGNRIDIALRVSLPMQNTRSATRTVRFSFIRKPPSLLQAENAVIVIQVPTTSQKPTVIVPKDAVIPITGGHMVYLAKGDRAKRRIIEIGAAVEDGFIVRRGLSAGQKVVVRGNEQLSDGKQIQVGKPKIGKLNEQTKLKSAQ